MAVTAMATATQLGMPKSCKGCLAQSGMPELLMAQKRTLGQGQTATGIMPVWSRIEELTNWHSRVWAEVDGLQQRGGIFRWVWHGALERVWRQL